MDPVSQSISVSITRVHVMPPPPHTYQPHYNNYNHYNNNNYYYYNRGKSHNKNHWNYSKRNNKNHKNDSQNLWDKDNKGNCNKKVDYKNVKYIYERNWDSHTYVSHHYYNPNFDHLSGLGVDSYYFVSTHQQYYGYNKKNNSHRQNRGDKRMIPYDGSESMLEVLIAKFMSRAHIIEMKEKPNDLEDGSEWNLLSTQIWEMFFKSQQKEETYKKKIYLWQYLYTFIKIFFPQRFFPRYGLFMVGSTMSGFGSNSSDVDICLLVRTSYVDQRTEALAYLEQIKLALLECDFIDRAEVIWAKVPILKFHDKIRNLDVDLNCNNSVGIRNTHLLHCYANIDWRVRPLVLVVKLWAAHNNINDAKNMTISSYSLVLMVLHFLQCGVTPPVIPCLHGLYPEKFLPDSDIHLIDMHERLQPFHSDNKQSLGYLFEAFLQYYATFNYTLYAISVRLGARIPIEECRYRITRSHRNDPYQWKFLCIEEPFDLTNTARSVYDPVIFEKIKKIFVRDYQLLQKNRDLKILFE